MRAGTDVADPVPTVDLDRPGDPAAWSRLMQSRRAEMDRLLQILQPRVFDAATLLVLMGRASRQAVLLLPGVDWAGVTAGWPTQPPFTACHTDELVLVVDEYQYGVDDGPCLQAMRTDRPVRMNAVQVAAVWPELSAAARRIGVASFVAVPLHTAGQSVGALNLYCSHPEPPEPDPDVLSILSAYLERGLTDYRTTRGLDGQLHQTLSDWALIERAAEVLMAGNGFDRDYALRVLRDEAEDWHRSLPDQAHQVLSAYLPPASP